MTNKLIPADVQGAAKRAFLRTASQSLALSFVLPAGVTIAFTGDALLATAVGLGGAVVGAVANGAQAYFDILGKGIPEDYAPTDYVPRYAAK